jgi:hypothetical protein
MGRYQQLFLVLSHLQFVFHLIAKVGQSDVSHETI